MGRLRVRAGVFLCVSLLLAGCGNSPETGEENRGNGQTASVPGGMGRYMETVYEMPEEINRNGGVRWLDDGSCTVISFLNGLYRSTDGGQTWQKEETDWFSMLEGVYCLTAVMGPDGTVAASCSGEMSEQVRDACKEPVPEDWEGNYCDFVMPEGTIKIVDFGFCQEDGTCIQSFVFHDDGRLFAADMQGKIYEIDVEKESFRELFMAEHAVGYMDFTGETLMAVGSDRLYLYDLKKEMLLPQDDTVDACIRRVLADGTVSWTSGGYPLAVTGSGEENVIYLACREGMYRHVLGGSVMEQVIDGALSTLGDSPTSIYRMKVLADQEFLVAFAPSAGLVRYTYNEEIASMPDRELRIYSLQDNRSIRQAVTAYKKMHTDMYVRYEVGLSGDGSLTAEDALKRLNTQMLAGDGPDVLILDGLPAGTYQEKGMLQDIRPILDNLGEGDTLFPNVVESCTDENGAIYAMPICIRVPLLAGDRETIAGMNDLESIAAEAERFRMQHPEGAFLGVYDPETLLHLFGMVSSSAWLDLEGQVDEDAVTEFLHLTKRIYDAELAGAQADQVERRQKEEAELAFYGVDSVQSRTEICDIVLDLPSGQASVAGGYVENIQLCLENVTSVLRTDETLAYRLLNGQSQNPFLPVAMVGISSGSGEPEAAEEFVQMMFKTDMQEKIYEGYPVNRAAYDVQFEAWEENSDNGSMILQTNDGSEQELFLYWPDQEERKQFTEYMENLQTSVKADEYLCELVYETGVQVLEGEKDAEEGAAEIVKKAAIYLAE